MPKLQQCNISIAIHHVWATSPIFL